ncbi:MAG TPA: glycosyltransferase [Chloroflexi bacterium]|nr:glycosyltransferase [Chloroflexota bacterium]
MPPSHRIGFVSTRLAGTDGVSLETAKWARVLTEMGHECFFFAGELDWPSERSYHLPEAHFQHPEIQAINADLFDDYRRSSKTSGEVHHLRYYIKEHLHAFIEKFDLELLITENALSIPMNVPLGLALTELIAETCMPTVGHHHDFFWERKRFGVSGANDYLRAAFPPTLPSIHHVVINSFAARQLALRTGVTSTVIPNVMDFDHPPDPPDAYSADLRAVLGLRPEERFILQPTRVVPRKRIEHAIEIVRRLGIPARLVITHSAGDEGTAYFRYLQEYARLLNTPMLFAAEHFNHVRQRTPDGRKIYALADAYQHADLVTYPSTVEGFGNAFLESIYYKRPLVMSTYEIFRTDIQPKGFQVVGFDDFITDETVEQARRILEDPALAEEITARNYELGRRHYSFRALEKHLTALMHTCLGA